MNTDQLNGLIILDLQSSKTLDKLAPHQGVYDLQNPKSLSSNIAIPAPLLATVGNWITEGDNF